MCRILIAEEKHRRRYLRAETPQQLFASALKLLKERINQYYHPSDEEIAQVQAHILSDEVIEKLPVGYRGDAQRKSAYKKRQLEDLLQQRDDWARAVQAVEENDGSLAWTVLSLRTDHQYEHVDIAYLE